MDTGTTVQAHDFVGEWVARTGTASKCSICKRSEMGGGEVSRHSQAAARGTTGELPVNNTRTVAMENIINGFKMWSVSEVHETGGNQNGGLL